MRMLDHNIRPVNMTLREIGSALWDIGIHYPISLWGAFKDRKQFDDIETCCLFIGYRRSGKTLTASLLDAHPNMAFAEEAGVLRYVYAGFTREQIYYLLLHNSGAFTKAGRKSKGCSHLVTGQWQGRFEKLSVIGDNHGEAVTMRLKARPWLLDRLNSVMAGRIKFLHVVRNPYDNISSISKRMGKSPEESAEYYFSLCRTVAKVMQGLSDDQLFEFRYEELVADPEHILKEICAFLGQDAPGEYLNDCTRLIFPYPRRTRGHITYDNRLIERIAKQISRFPFLKGYNIWR